MKILVIGIQHSCTRLFVGLLSQHPEIKSVGHQSIPSEKSYHHFCNKFTTNKIKFDNIVLVVRDKGCVNKSNLKHNAFNIAEKGAKFIKDEINKIRKEDRKKIIITSYEMLYQFKELTLRQLFRSINVDEDNYDYNKKGTVKCGWIRTSLHVKDVNSKYLSKISDRHNKQMRKIKEKEKELNRLKNEIEKVQEIKKKRKEEIQKIKDLRKVKEVTSEMKRQEEHRKEVLKKKIPRPKIIPIKPQRIIPKKVVKEQINAVRKDKNKSIRVEKIDSDLYISEINNQRKMLREHRHRVKEDKLHRRRNRGKRNL